MIETPTVLIIGAGANYYYGFPTGNDLRNRLCNDFSRKLESLHNYDSGELEYPKSLLQQIPKFCEAFRLSSISSIDSFLARNPSFEEIGKFGILNEIFDSENNTKFEKNTTDNWYPLIFNKLVEDSSYLDGYKYIHKNKLNIITFNYDRSLDWFLENALINTYYDSKIGREILAGEKNVNEYFGFNIHHVYGSLGLLPSQNNGKGIEYRAPNRYLYRPLLKNIRLINERTEEIEEIKKIVISSQKVIFLGFGFADDNMKVLGFPFDSAYNHTYFCTVYGLYDQEKERINTKYLNRKGVLLGSESLCSEIIRKYL